MPPRTLDPVIQSLTDVLQYATDDPKFQEQLSTLDPNQPFAKAMAIHEKNKKALQALHSSIRAESNNNFPEKDEAAPLASLHKNIPYEATLHIFICSIRTSNP